MQSWGSSSLYDRRETDNMPTKSGVIGLLAAALGRKRDESLEDLASLKFGVRIDLPGEKIEDFQVTHMGEKLNANLSRRVYLSDALFLVGLSCDDTDFLRKLESAVQKPEFAMFLGRRSCPPTLPLDLGIKELDLYHALLEQEWLLPEWRRESQFRFQNEVRLRIITDADFTEENVATKKDVPVSFSPYNRQYRYRYMMERVPKVCTASVIAEELEHDPFKELE